MSEAMVPAEGGGPISFPKRLFGLDAPVDRRFYALTGFSLSAIKYGLDVGIVYATTGHFWTPLQYLSPLLTLREHTFSTTGPWVPITMLVLSLPFLWVGVSMTIRRVANAGLSPWLGLVYFVPFLNYLALLIFCILPSKQTTSPVTHEPDVYRENAPAPLAPVRVQSALQSALLGVAAGLGIAMTMTLLSVYALGAYGASLFLGTPFVMGVVSSFLYNRLVTRTAKSSALVGILSVVISGGVVLVSALEGLVCISMAAPLALGLGLVGALIGRQIALNQRSRGHLIQVAGVIGFLPLAAGAETLQPVAPLYEVISTIEIDAPPEAVWPNVVGFKDIDLAAPPALVYQLGVAYPIRARIVGEGVGAVRHCEFSTGAFVEPITRWDAPTRLSFDVASQPAPMHEWSPYRQIHPPHLDGYLRSKRGEFRLVPIDGGARTRLEGSTWYELDVAPRFYWTVWTDALIHGIHTRVLKHVKALSEQTAHASNDVSHDASSDR